MCFFHQKIFKILAATGLWLCLLPLAAGATNFDTREIGVVVVDRLNLRLGRGTGYPVVKVLQKDDQVKVLAHEENWLKVLHDADVGYVADESRYITLYTIHSISDAKHSELEQATARAAEIREKVEQHNETIAQYNRREKKLINALHQTDQDLNAARKKLSAVESDMAAADAEISALQEQVDRARQQIGRNRKYAVNRLVAVYKLHTLGEANLLASATSLQDLMRRRSGVEKILQYDHEVISRLTEKKTRLDELLAALETEKRKKENLVRDCQALAADLKKERKQREVLLSEIRQKKTHRLATIKYLKNAAIQLDKTIDSLRQGDSSRAEANHFSAYQGLLKMPVNGTVVSKFGKYTEPQSGASSFRNGIDIQAGRGAPVRAVFSGKTIYSSWLKGYGNVMIIAHGKDFHTVYAHVEELFREKGEIVETGEVIATVGDSGAISGPSLYFEIRYQGSPVDPLEWVNNS